MSDREALAAVVATARETRRRILARIKRLPRNRRSEALAIARRELERAEPLLARLIRDGQLLAWLAAAKEPVKALALPDAREPAVRVPNPSVDERTPTSPTIRPEPALPVRPTPQPSSNRTPPPDSPRAFPERPGDPEPIIRFPQVEKAARFLRTRLAYTPAEYAQLDADARSVAFTVAKATTLDAVEKVREALAEDVARGGTLKAFRGAVEEALGASALAEHQVEGLYRTHVARAYAAGQREILDHPLVSDEFPYLLYVATHDARVRPEHLAMESLGLNGTAVYRADDPIWDLYYPPWDWNCRCIVIPLSIEDAAARGVMEAIKWLETGDPPASPQFVDPLPFSLPKGWVPVGRRLRPAI